MRNQTGYAITITAAVAAALALGGCDQRSTDTAARRADAPMATAPATDTSQKVAAATDKVATAVDDSALTAKVKAALLAEPGLKSLQIGVETKNGAVILSGSVDSATSRDRAKDVASGVAGVSTVVDQLTVKTS
jgi:hyperosmotically inducible periplasmic protein